MSRGVSNLPSCLTFCLNYTNRLAHTYSNGEGRREVVVVGDSQDGWSCGVQLLPLAHSDHTHLLLHRGEQILNTGLGTNGHSTIYNTSLVPRPHARRRGLVSQVQILGG